MPRRPKGSVPSLQHHKPSGRARVTIQGRDHWLGKWGSPEARLAYERLIAEYLATGRVRDPEPPSVEAMVVALDPGTPGLTVVTPRSPAPAAAEENVSAEPTVAEVVLRYLEYCDTYYRTPMGERTSTYGNALQAARALRPFDDTLAAKFGPRKLGMIRDSHMVTVGSLPQGLATRAMWAQKTLARALKRAFMPRLASRSRPI